MKKIPKIINFIYVSISAYKHCVISGKLSFNEKILENYNDTKSYIYTLSI
jgi:hypothetical protein